MLSRAMRIFLVRHGQSRSNVDWSENRRVPDHAIELSEEGHRQARACGAFLAEYFSEHLLARHTAGSTLPLIRLWHSPHTRTRQTADGVVETCRLPSQVTLVPSPGRGGETRTAHIPSQTRDGGASCFVDRKEHLLLAEQQFGIFDGLDDTERAERYPDFHAYYEKCKKFEGKLWPKMPLGESRFDVCQRVHQAFGTFKRDEDMHGIENIVVVGHGTTNRAFVMMWLHLPYEWMHDEPNPNNASVRLIESGQDRGYIFPGFEDPRGGERSITKETEE